VICSRLTKSVLETSLEAELTEHLRYEQYDAVGRGGNSRNGTRTKTVFTLDRAGADRGAAGPGWHVRAGDRRRSGNAGCPGSTRSSRRCRPRFHHWGDLGALRRRLRRHRVQGHRFRITAKVLEEMANWRARLGSTMGHARWKPVVNAFAVTFEGRIDPTTTN